VGRAVAQIGGMRKTGWAGRGNSWPKFSVFLLFFSIFHLNLRISNSNMNIPKGIQQECITTYFYIHIYLLSYLGKYFQI
jgi:hypothetical protein